MNLLWLQHASYTHTWSPLKQQNVSVQPFKTALVKPVHCVMNCWPETKSSADAHWWLHGAWPFHTCQKLSIPSPPPWPSALPYDPQPRAEYPSSLLITSYHILITLYNTTQLQVCHISVQLKVLAIRKNAFDQLSWWPATGKLIWTFGRRINKLENEVIKLDGHSGCWI